MISERSRAEQQLAAWRHLAAAWIGRLWAPLGSVLLHGMWVYAAAFSPPSQVGKPLVEFVQIEWDNAELKAPVLQRPLHPAPAPPVQRTPRQPPARGAAARRPASQLQPTAAAIDAHVSPPRELPDRDAHEPMRTDYSLSPASVAAATFSIASSDAPEPAPVGTDRDKATRLSRALTEELRLAAAEITHLSKRPPPKLKRLHDGSYSWEGSVFTARIAPDGTVSFDDAPDFIVDGFGIGPFMIGNDPRRGREPAPTSFSMTYYLRELVDYLPVIKLFGHFDLEAALARARSGDPHVAERLWFLQQTEALRRDLAAIKP